MRFEMITILFFKIVLYIPLTIIRKIERIKLRKNHKLPLDERYGMEAFCGLAGAGKTTTLVYKLWQLRKEYGDDIYIFTNFPCRISNAIFTDYKQLLRNFDKPVFIGWDELPNDFSKNGYKDFPEDLLFKLTQLRKGNGVKIYYTCQDITLVDVAFRRLTFYIYDCQTFKGYLTYCVKYRTDYYFHKKSIVSTDSKEKIICDGIFWFFQNQELRSLFDSFGIVQQSRTHKKS